MSDNDARKTEHPPEPEDDAATPEASESVESAEAARADAAAEGEEPGDENDPVVRAEALAQAYKEQLLRTRADAENQRKRLERDNANAVKYAAEKAFRDLLAVIDSLDLGLKAARDADAAQAVIEGIELTRKQLGDTLAQHGVSELDPSGAAFDPAIHEAVSVVPSAEMAPNHVLEVLQRGYQLHERVLRPARVVVTAAPPQQGSDDAAPTGG